MKSKRQKRHEICLVLDKRGLNVYGNRQAFIVLAEEMKRLAKSDKDGYWECHVHFHIGSYLKQAKNQVFTLLEKGVAPYFQRKKSNQVGFELTFMTVESKDLRKLRAHKKLGILPLSWSKSYSIPEFVSC